jgi:hypothetical protein
MNNNSEEGRTIETVDRISTLLRLRKTKKAASMVEERTVTVVSSVEMEELE